MAFKPSNLALLSVYQTPPALGVPQFWGYTTTDTVATVSAAQYFNLGQHIVLPPNTTFYVGDQITCICSDGETTLLINTIDANGLNVTTVAPAADIAAGSITTAMLGNLIVTAAKIANGTITAPKIANGAITAAQINAAAGILGTQLANNTITSAQLDPTTIQYAKVPMTAAQWNGMYAAPFLLVAAPGANKQIIVHNSVLAMTFVSAQYLLGGAVALQYDSTAHGAGPLASATLSAVTVDAYAASSDVSLAGTDTSGATAAKINKGLYISNDTAAFTTGDGTWNIHVWYSVVTL